MTKQELKAAYQKEAEAYNRRIELLQNEIYKHGNELLDIFDEAQRRADMRSAFLQIEKDLLAFYRKALGKITDKLDGLEEKE